MFKCENFTIGFLDHVGITKSDRKCSKSSICVPRFAVVMFFISSPPSVQVQWVFLEVAWERVVRSGKLFLIYRNTAIGECPTSGQRAPRWH